VLKERGIVDVSHQTIINYLARYGLKGNHIETSMNGRLRLKLVIGKKLKGMGEIPIFVLDREDNLVDLHLVERDQVPTLRSMVLKGWFLQVLLSLDLALYSLINPYDLEVTRGSASLASELTYRLQDYFKGRKGNIRRFVGQFIRENG